METKAQGSIETLVEKYFSDYFVAGVQDFVRVDNTTPSDSKYDPSKLDAAIEVVNQYCNKFGIAGISRKIFPEQPPQDPKYPKLVVYHLPGTGKNVLLYGHLDKVIVNESEWDVNPRDPQINEATQEMNGRGSSDDGYASFAIFTALKVCQDLGITLPNITLVLETEEESDSSHLKELLSQAEGITGTPDYLICLDSGLVDYKHLWVTSSLRGYCEFNLKIQAASQDYHSGEAGGIVPETFSVIRALLDKLDVSSTGAFKEFQEPIPDWKVQEAREVVSEVGDVIVTKFKLVDGAQYMKQDLQELYLDNVWRPTMAIVGIDGIPKIGDAKNVIRASTTVRVGLRIPPTSDPKAIAARVQELMTTEVPYNAKVTLEGDIETGLGWCMKGWEDGDKFEKILDEVSQTYFQTKKLSYGDGASIPFLKELELKYPSTRILAIGVLGPGSNAHSKNECLNLSYAKKMICILADIFQGLSALR